MLRFEGDRTLPQALDTVWSQLTDARFLARCIPDVESIGTQDADHLTLVLRPGFAFMRGTLAVDLRIVERVPTRSARILNQSKGIGSSATVETQLAFQAAGTGTQIHWTAEVKELGGLLKMVPPGLIRGSAEKVITDAWATVEKQLAAGPAPEKQTP